MNVSAITSCYLGPQISPEQFVSEHFFLYLIKGTIDYYDGSNHHHLQPGECCLVRKNHLVKYTKRKADNQFEKVVVVFDEVFLKAYQAKHPLSFTNYNGHDAYFLIQQNELIPNFLQSLNPYYTNEGKINPMFADLKREELLLILLQSNPELATILFDFSSPQKIDLEAYMNRNFRFNVSVERFAYLTGRSLSAFKRDFDKIFHETPSRWLVHKRLQEAYFLIEKQAQKPSDIYLDLGFEDLSHFSFAFKKRFGVAPTQLAERRQLASP
ncbi:AraC family transcriptional regulator [Spirosoma aerolatum]|uniref:AraC family transcriptional regulator n=1 Tax=Spirosoma aerolatum TaxID=1211326 RepID=UPI0009AEB0F9|nr:AraC family transcriptional regulator [Spirosoma aerolatum]